MDRLDFRTYVPCGFKYEGFGGRPLCFASALRDNLKGKRIGDPEADQYEAIIERHDAVPIPYRGRIIPSWALLDFYKLRELNPKHGYDILRPDRQKAAEQLEKQMREERKDTSDRGRASLQASEERYGWLLRNSLDEKEIPELGDVLKELGAKPLENEPYEMPRGSRFSGARTRVA